MGKRQEAALETRQKLIDAMPFLYPQQTVPAAFSNRTLQKASATISLLPRTL